MKVTKRAPSDLVAIQAHATAIAGVYAKSLEATFEVGWRLRKAKKDLGHGAWGRMFAQHKSPIDLPLPFSQDTAEKFMRIAACEHLQDSETLRKLPASYSTLYELARLKPEVFARLLGESKITPDLTVEEAGDLVYQEESRERREARAAQNSEPSSSEQPTTSSQEQTAPPRPRSKWERRIGALLSNSLSDDEGDWVPALAMDIFETGFKAMAAKAHPDKGGTHDEMTRLLRAREWGRISLEYDADE